LLRQHNANAKC